MAGTCGAGFRFAVAPDGGYFAVKAGKTEGETPKIDIALPGDGVRAEALSFLLAAGLGTETPGTHQRTEIGALAVTYADGKTKKIPLALLVTVNHWNVFASGYRIRFADRFNDTRGALAGFFALDWKNPRQKTPITSISLEANGALGMPVALFAVSAGRRDDAAKKLPAAKFDDDAVAARLTEWSRGIHERNAAADTSGDVAIMPLEAGIPDNAKFALTGKSVGGMVKTVVDDPTAPTPGKVLRLDIPPSAPGETRRQRLTIDIWYDFSKLPSVVKTLIFDYKYASNSVIFIPACYLSASTSQSLRKIPFSDPLAPEGKWYSVKLPVDKMRREGGKFELRDANRVRLSIFFHTHAEPTTVWFSSVRISTVRQQTPPMIRIEKVPEVNEEIPAPTQVAL